MNVHGCYDQYWWHMERATVNKTGKCFWWSLQKHWWKGISKKRKTKAIAKFFCITGKCKNSKKVSHFPLEYLGNALQE